VGNLNAASRRGADATPKASCLMLSSAFSTCSSTSRYRGRTRPEERQSAGVPQRVASLASADFGFVSPVGREERVQSDLFGRCRRMRSVVASSVGRSPRAKLGSERLHGGNSCLCSGSSDWRLACVVDVELFCGDTLSGMPARGRAQLLHVLRPGLRVGEDGDHAVRPNAMAPRRDRPVTTTGVSHMT